MRLALLLVLLLLTATAQAQIDQDKCLVEGADGNRASGVVEYVSYEHPRGFAISGYKLVLLKSRCYEGRDLETGRMVKIQISEMAIWNYGRIHFLQTLIGKTATITGTMEANATIYYVAVPQIIPTSLEACEVSPASNGITKC